MTTEPRRFARDVRKTPTSAEDTMWQALRGRKLAGMKFRRQVPVLNYTVDFVCFDSKLIVELDGKQHDWFAEYDAKRTGEIERHGFAVIRFQNAEVLTDLESVLARIGAAVSPSKAPAHPHPRPLSHPGEGRGARNPSPGWERGRGEGVPSEVSAASAARISEAASPHPASAHPHPRPLSHSGEGR